MLAGVQSSLKGELDHWLRWAVGNVLCEDIYLVCSKGKLERNTEVSVPYSTNKVAQPFQILM